jgi:hypothetical protein
VNQRLSFSKFFLISLFIFAGCNAPKDQLNVFNTHFRNCDYQKSAEFAQSKISKGKRPAREDLLWALQAGSVERLRGNYQQSTELFDKSEEFLNYYDFQNEAAGAIAATIVNENINPYAGEEYDGVMVNTYKALNFMKLGKDELVRVEFNRALDRQRRAKEKFAKEIAKLNNEIEQEEQKGKAPVKQSVENPQVQSIISEKYPSLYAFKAYPDFVNPLTTYIAGIYFNLVGDHTKAIDLLKESYGMVPDNNYIAEDLALTEKILDGQEQLQNIVWVIFENGLGPVKEEFRIDLPLFIVTSKVKYVGIALPKLVFREQACPYLSVKAGDNTYQTQQIADMDRVIQTEFSKDFKAILTRAIISATAKAAAQYVLDQQGSSEASILSIAVAAYSFVTTAADVRIWTTLPKDFQVARLKIPDDRIINISGQGGIPIQVPIPPCKNAMIYVKIPVREAIPVYDVMTY